MICDASFSGDKFYIKPFPIALLLFEERPGLGVGNDK